MSQPSLHLPRPLTSFVGRERELAELARLLSDARLLTIVGAPGAGKTRLAIELARSVAPRFPDGTWLVDLAPVNDPQLVPLQIASALGVTGVASEQPMEAVNARLLTAHVLLILDNCEHLIAACAQAAESMLTACPDVRVLATSREALQVAGELAWRAPSLAVPATEPAGLESLATSEAVRLFVERARHVDSDFKLTPANRSEIAQIVRRLDGIPLAIELAAARMQVMTPVEVLEHLENRFELLTGGSRTALPRQRTLRATVDWSYELLDERERLLFRRLSVFSGGFSLDAAEAICPGDDLEAATVLELLSHLAAKSLVSVPHADGRTRYQLLETLRQYAQDRLLESGEAERLRDRHARHFRELAATAAPHLTEAQNARWLERLEADHDNLRAALTWLERRSPDDLLELVAHLARFWYLYGYGLERLRWCETALRLSNARVPARLAVLGWLAEALQRHDDSGQARERASELYELATALGDDNWRTRALVQLSRAALASADSARAREHIEGAVALSTSMGDRRLVALAQTDHAHVALAIGDLDVAERLLKEALANAIALGERQGESAILDSAAAVALAQGRRDAARRLYLASLDIALELHYAFGFVNAVEGLAMVASANGQFERALRLGGAGAALRSSLFTKKLVPFRAMLDDAMARARRSLPEAVANAAWSAGTAMSREQVLEMLRTTAARPPADSGPLSAREAEIAALVADGKTNRQMADHLGIAERTVDAHVAHILDKLGFHSRSEIAAWAVRTGIAVARTG